MMLEGKRAVITGGSRGIGRSIAGALGREGCSLLLISRTESELATAKTELSKAGGKIETAVLDVASAVAPAEIKNAIERVFPEGIDILITAAGVYGPIGLIHEVDPAVWRKAIEINLFGTFAAIQAAVPFMQKRGGGKIITFSGGGEGAYPHFSSYAASKGGVVRLTETLASELAGFHIDINAIAPGAVNTKFLDELLAAGPEKVGKETYYISLKQKDGGGVAPEKAAELVLFLASPESDGISGKVISAIHDNYSGWNRHLKEIIKSDVYNFRRIKPKDRGFDWT